NAAIVRAMTLGESRGLDEETRSRFELSGAYHVLVVSGMHVGLLAALAIGLIRALGLPMGLAWSTGAAVAFGYALLLDSQLPVSRAAWMLAAYLTASAVYRRRQALNVICGVALAFLCWEPAWIADAGFQLSFLAVAAIAGIGAPLAERVTRPRRQVLRDIWNADRDMRLPVEVVVRRVALRDWLEPLSRIVGLRKRWVELALVGPARIGWAAVSVLIVSAAITLVLAAPLAYHFQRLALAAPFANLAVAPLLIVIAPAGFAALLTGALPLFQLATAAAGLLSTCVSWVSQWDGLQYQTPPPGAWSIAAALASCVLLARAIDKGRWQAWMAAAAAAACWVVIALHPFAPDLKKGRLELTAIDVGQGEALLVGLADGEAGLVDAGGFPNFGSDEPSAFDIGERIVAPYLGRRGIKRLAFLAITHADADHMAGAEAVLRRFAPRELWLPRILLSAEFRPLLEAARESGTRIRFLASGDSFAAGAVDVTAIVCELCTGRNDRSLVLVFDYGEHRFLLTGDIEHEGEQYLIAHLNNPHIAVLKTPHHGSRNSTSDVLLKLTHPTVAIVSAGFENLYGHPHAEVIQRLARRHVSVLRTDLDGAATVSSDGRRLEWKAQRHVQEDSR
ncbi:MAG: ComEC/Rec2 family competence protein, partial [Acidobacteria bacterium]|nr:ComEC/Rec2 family competence protein [Acidobacteriota bacterium]